MDIQNFVNSDLKNELKNKWKTLFGTFNTNDNIIKINETGWNTCLRLDEKLPSKITIKIKLIQNVKNMFICIAESTNVEMTG